MKRLLFLGVLYLLLSSCSNNGIENNIESKQVDHAIYDESNYSFTTIDLWGSEAAVLDSGDYYIFQGDIVIKKEDLLQSQTRGAARIDKRWTDNKVYYSLKDVPNTNTSKLYEALGEIEKNTYLKFIPRLEGERNYIEINFINQDKWIATSNYIGMKGGKQVIKLSKNAWEKGTIIHEICHALGLYHEQCRADRDNHVLINFAGMTNDERYQYKTYKELSENGKDVGAFDFQSIMLYGSRLNGKVVMTKRDGSTFFGQRNGLSSGDIAALAQAQPVVKYTFYDPLGHNEPQDSPYRYIRSKYLRCPEKTDITFKFQYKFETPQSLINSEDAYKPMPPIEDYETFSLNDFEVKATVEVINNYTLKTVSKEFVLTKSSTFKEEFFTLGELPQGFYTTKLILTGLVKGKSTPGKQKTLEKLLYAPSIYLHLNKVLINNKSILIPNSFSYPASERVLTFIKI